MAMLKGLVYLIITGLILVYTVSYAIYELKNKNILAFVGVIIVCVALVLTPVGVILYF